MPPKTATGTIAVQVADSNDHCPTLSSTASGLCSDKKTVFITAFDEDAHPNADPFSFTIIPGGTKGSWDLEVINGMKFSFRSTLTNFTDLIYLLGVQRFESHCYSLFGFCSESFCGMNCFHIKPTITCDSSVCQAVVCVLVLKDMHNTPRAGDRKLTETKAAGGTADQIMLKITMKSTLKKRVKIENGKRSSDH